MQWKQAVARSTTALAMSAGLVLGVASGASAHVPTPTGNEGCTPGFYKNNLNAWPSVKPNVYYPGDRLGKVFPVLDLVNSPLRNDTLLTALKYPGSLGPQARLMRAAVAALLNVISFDVDYPIGAEGQLKSKVTAAIQNGSLAALDGLKNQLDAWNNGPGGCPLRAAVK